MGRDRVLRLAVHRELARAGLRELAKARLRAMETRQVLQMPSPFPYRRCSAASRAATAFRFPARAPHRSREGANASQRAGRAGAAPGASAAPHPTYRGATGVQSRILPLAAPSNKSCGDWGAGRRIPRTQVPATAPAAHTSPLRRHRRSAPFTQWAETKNGGSFICKREPTVAPVAVRWSPHPSIGLGCGYGCRGRRRSETAPAGCTCPSG